MFIYKGLNLQFKEGKFMKKILKKKITIISVICSMIFAMVAFPVGAAHTLTFKLDGGNISGNANDYVCQTETCRR